MTESPLDPRILKLKTEKDCSRFATNAIRLNRPDLAIAATRRSLELKAGTHGAIREVEIECLKAVYAYEEALSTKNGRATRANRTWQMIKRHGIVPAVERAVNRSHETMGYTTLCEKGLEDFAFEAVILRYPEIFTAETVERSKERMANWKNIDLKV